jgi:hypothetical protein
MSFIKVRHDWRSIKTDWQQIGAQLCILDPVVLSDKDFRLIAQWRKNSGDIEARRQLPLVVAHFRQVAQEEIMNWARMHVAERRDTPHNDLPVLLNYCADMNLLDEVLFGSGKKKNFVSEIGVATQDPWERVHIDNEIWYQRVYLSRLQALPTLYIRGEKLSKLPKVKRHIVDWLIDRSVKGHPMAEKLLAKMGLLEAGLLNAVTVHAPFCHAGHDEATLHCASNLPRQKGKLVPTASALLVTLKG